MISDSQKRKACEIGKNSVVKKLREHALIEPDCTGVDNAIRQLKKKIKAADKEIDNLVAEVFSIAVEAGFKRALKRFEDGTITTRKIRNEDSWNLYCNSRSFSISEEIKISSKSIKIQTKIRLKDMGFE